ncbi:UDP-N-acetylglucosamine 2-epimerase [Cohnella cholangitidis]|uniref:UDP-N-acetylglucosamine 2-epimerase (Hydrolyzing) n=1 Tax=Cohnella cholangitidis TaxID=2598458 RepID=A0A7G5BXL9_9BACL|nr:UDP-N-acetylglucosamine 2-epimerase [Cohnella cholangitidis]QMV41703.1 UDP-N-acetylglucosamine 2-epimerase (hydrolyzing) [Cohnella cholangitidis]
MSKRKICVVTGTRAEYGLLYWLLKELEAEPTVELQLIVSGMHLSPEFGSTYKFIEQDGFIINEKIEMLLSSDTPVGITKSIGLAVLSFAECLDRLKPDILVLAGDRYEILAAAQAALIAQIPIAHLFGGDTTEGAFDEAIRHSITKMSHLHFVSNGHAAKRVRQLGENPKHIFNVGSTGLDFVRKATLLTKDQLSERLEFEFRKRNVAVTFHPATLDAQRPEEQFSELLHALESLGQETGIIITKPNSDTYGRKLIEMTDEFVKSHSNAKAYTSLGQLPYLSLLSHVDAVIGNSSSGLYEAPTFKIPTVNIGSRQRGRMQASSVIDCEPNRSEISKAMTVAFAMDCTNTVNPYGEGRASERVAGILKDFDNLRGLIQKSFYEVDDHESV